LVLTPLRSRERTLFKLPLTDTHPHSHFFELLYTSIYRRLSKTAVGSRAYSHALLGVHSRVTSLFLISAEVRLVSQHLWPAQDNMSKGKKKARSCSVCGRSARGHPGPIGPGRCLVKSSPPDYQVLDILECSIEREFIAEGDRSVSQDNEHQSITSAGNGRAEAPTLRLPDWDVRSDAGRALAPPFPSVAPGGRPHPDEFRHMGSERGTPPRGHFSKVTATRWRRSEEATRPHTHLLQGTRLPHYSEAPAGAVGSSPYRLDECDEWRAPPNRHENRHEGRHESAFQAAGRSNGPPGPVAWNTRHAEDELHQMRHMSISEGRGNCPPYRPPSNAGPVDDYIARRPHYHSGPDRTIPVFTQSGPRSRPVATHGFRYDDDFSVPAERNYGYQRAPNFDMGPPSPYEQHHGAPLIGAEHVPRRTRESAIAGEYVELVDLMNNMTNDCDEFKSMIDAQGNVNFRYQKTKKSIMNVYKWISAWSVYEIILCDHFGISLFTHLVSYRTFIVDMFQKYKFPYVITYDSRHRQRLGARSSFAFSKLDQELYITTFDASALRNITKCQKCAATDHSSSDCPFRPPGQAKALPVKPRSADLRSAEGKSVDPSFCMLFQDELCKSNQNCRRRHACYGCGKANQPLKTCKKCLPNGHCT